MSTGASPLTESESQNRACLVEGLLFFSFPFFCFYFFGEPRGFGPMRERTDVGTGKRAHTHGKSEPTHVGREQNIQGLNPGNWLGVCLSSKCR